mgnify:CR=1 FL=1
MNKYRDSERKNTKHSIFLHITILCSFALFGAYTGMITGIISGNKYAPRVRYTNPIGGIIGFTVGGWIGNLVYIRCILKD